MATGRFRCTLTTPEGASRRVDALGVLVGRDPECDIVVEAPEVSRRHALVRIDNDGAELVVLGRVPVLHDGKPCERQQRLADGAELQVGPLVLRVALERVAAPDARSSFRLLVRGASYGVRHTPFSIGGDPHDDLILDGWPAGALRLHVTGAELCLEATVPDVRRNDEPVGDELAALAAGDVVTCLGTPIGIGEVAAAAHTTITGPALPSKVIVEMLPRGGRVVFAMPSGEHCVYLADRRLDLIAALVRPPAGYQPGDFIPDDVLRPLVWPGNPNVIRSEINVHLTRCRKDLVAAGLPGPRLLERAPGGGATRLALAPGCEIVFL